jgi:adenine-specific DNA-methyltransferase
VAALDELLGRIEDEALRADLERELGPLRAVRELGLVFERHLPEKVRLPGLPIRRGVTVEVAAELDSPTWRVAKVGAGDAHLERRGSGGVIQTDTRTLDELVVVREFGDPIYPGLRSVGRLEQGGDKPFHAVIKAENFHALEALGYTCESQVDCIYIDPPYNTGARDWKYNNDFVDSNDTFRHSKWLSFMEKRLKLAKRLLNPDDSVLIVTIDEKEYLRLGLLLEQVFPAARIQMTSVNINPAAVARNGYFGRSDEYYFFVMLGDAGVRPMTLGPEWITTKGRTHHGQIRWDLLRKSGSSPLRQGHAGTFYPVFLSSDGSQIAEIGEPIGEGVARSTLTAPAGKVIVWPIRDDGSEGRWAVGPKIARQLLESGLLKLGKFKGENTPIYYLAKGERQKITDGVYTVTGRAEDGSVITSDLEDPTRTAVPGSQWRESRLTTRPSTVRGYSPSSCPGGSSRFQSRSTRLRTHCGSS